jgi:hypothetical protein
MFQMAVYFGYNIYKVENGNCIPPSLKDGNTIGIISGDSIEELVEKFNLARPAGFVQWSK